MLTCHKNVVIPPECGFAVWWYEKYKAWPAVAGHEPYPFLVFLGDLFQSRKFETWGLEEEDLFRFLTERQPDCYASLVSAIYEWYGLSRGKDFQRWGDKNNFHIDHILTIRAIFPDCHFLHIVRDGRNVACSYKALHQRKLRERYAPQLPHEIGEIARTWSEGVRTVIASFEALNWVRVYEVRLEDILLETEETLRALCGAIDEEFDPAMLDYYLINKRDELEPAELMAWKEKTLQEPLPAEVTRYERELTDQENTEFRSIAERELRRYGYLL